MTNQIGLRESRPTTTKLIESDLVNLAPGLRQSWQSDPKFKFRDINETSLFGALADIKKEAFPINQLPDSREDQYLSCLACQTGSDRLIPTQSLGDGVEKGYYLWLNPVTGWYEVGFRRYIVIRKTFDQDNKLISIMGCDPVGTPEISLDWRTRADEAYFRIEGYNEAGSPNSKIKFKFKKIAQAESHLYALSSLSLGSSNEIEQNWPDQKDSHRLFIGGSNQINSPNLETKLELEKIAQPEGSIYAISSIDLRLANHPHQS